MNNISEREQWFIDRVGKRVYSNRQKSIQHLNDNGIIIECVGYAHGLYNIELSFKDIPIKFFDTPEERDAFELILKK
jgi:hypothetical protein